MSEARAAEGAQRGVGRYRLCFEIAAGGMATVYLAQARGPAGFDKVVALKQIHRHLAKDRDFVEMFLDEARLAARIQHPNVCSVIDFGEADGDYFLTMEYLLGEPLGALMRKLREGVAPESAGGPRVPFEAVALRLIADAAEGLHAAHELRDRDGRPLQVVHRDVSPENLFVTYDGGMRVVDFGIARAENRVHATRTGQVKGNFAYMAPEQMAGLAVDRRADLWSLGVILYELLSGERLFKRESLPETVTAVTNQSIGRLAGRSDFVDGDLDAIVRRCLSRDREGRFGSARELSRAIEHWLGGAGLSVGMADVAEWMQLAFPEGLETRRRLLERASRGEGEARAGPAGKPPAAFDEGSHSTVKAYLRRDAQPGDPAMAPTLVDVRADARTAAHIGAGATEIPGRRRWRAGLVAGLSAAGLLFGLGLWAGDRSQAPEPAAQVGVERAPPEPLALEPATAPAPAVFEPEPEPSDVEVPEAPESGSEAAGAASVAPAVVDEGAARPLRSKRKAIAPRRPAKSAGQGYISVATPGGWAEVYLGSRKLGVTPGRFTLPAGRHRLSLRPGTGGQAISVDVEVRAGQTTRLRRAL